MEKKNDLNNLVERLLEESISDVTNLLHSAGENEINVSDFVNNDWYIKHQENSLNISKIFETVVNSPHTTNVDSNKEEPEKINLQAEMGMFIKSTSRKNLYWKPKELFFRKIWWKTSAFNQWFKHALRSFV